MEIEAVWYDQGFVIKFIVVIHPTLLLPIWLLVFLYPEEMDGHYCCLRISWMTTHRHFLVTFVTNSWNITILLWIVKGLLLRKSFPSSIFYKRFKTATPESKRDSGVYYLTDISLKSELSAVATCWLQGVVGFGAAQPAYKRRGVP